MLHHLMILDTKGFEKVRAYSRQGAYPIPEEVFELAILLKKELTQIHSSMTAFYIGAWSLLAGLVAQVLPWEETTSGRHVRSVGGLWPLPSWF